MLVILSPFFTNYLCVPWILQRFSILLAMCHSISSTNSRDAAIVGFIDMQFEKNEIFWKKKKPNWTPIKLKPNYIYTNSPGLSRVSWIQTESPALPYGQPNLLDNMNKRASNTFFGGNFGYLMHFFRLNWQLSTLNKFLNVKQG